MKGEGKEKDGKGTWEGTGKPREEPSRIRMPKKSGERVFEADSLMFSCEAVENRIARSKST